jgi:hypothetical protein
MTIKPGYSSVVGSLLSDVNKNSRKQREENSLSEIIEGYIKEMGKPPEAHVRVWTCAYWDCEHCRATLFPMNVKMCPECDSDLEYEKVPKKHAEEMKKYNNKSL